MTARDKCRCGHKREDHDKSQSINYTQGKCTKCSCKNFCMPRTDKEFKED